MSLADSVPFKVQINPLLELDRLNEKRDLYCFSLILLSLMVRNNCTSQSTAKYLYDEKAASYNPQRLFSKL